MSDEQKKVLQMLSDGKVTADQAERLLIALTGRRRPKRRCIGRSRGNGPDLPLLPSDLPMYSLPLQM